MNYGYKMKPLKTIKARAPFKKSRTVKTTKTLKTMKTNKAR